MPGLENAGFLGSVTLQSLSTHRRASCGRPVQPEAQRWAGTDDTRDTHAALHALQRELKQPLHGRQRLQVLEQQKEGSDVCTLPRQASAMPLLANQRLSAAATSRLTGLKFS